MADTQGRKSGKWSQQSRLQRKAPASIQISPVSDWKVAIPLLSPLATSPNTNDLTAGMKPYKKEESRKEQGHHNNQLTETEKKPTVLKKWQHPAAPFCYEPAPLVPFICTGGVDRSL